jgi:hypothetical protein
VVTGRPCAEDSVNGRQSHPHSHHPHPAWPAPRTYCSVVPGANGVASGGHCGWMLDRFQVIPRKEVIQPQLPLRLPCYDFVPITHPTLDGCLPCGLAHRLQVLPAFVT